MFDRNYSRDYGLDYSAYNLSKINFDYIKNRTYYGVKAIYFQELEFQSKERSAPKILPSISTHNETKSLFLKEKFMLDTNTVILTRNNGLQYKRMTMIPNFKIPFNINGNLFEISSKLQNDLYLLNDKDLRINNIKLYNNFQRDLKTEFSASWSLPMLKKNKNSSITLEPIANFVVSGYKAQNNLIPLEDSLDGELTFSNLFINDRISGFDRNESGKRVSYGVRSSLFNRYGEFNFTSGQALLLSKNEQDAKIRGFASNNKSNVVGILGFRGKKYFAISYAFQLDQSDYRNEINQINTVLDYKKYALNIDYLLIRRNSVNLSAREQVNVSNVFKLPYNLNLRINVIRDLELKRNIVRGVEIRRNGCCTDFSFSVIENNPSSLSKPQKNFKMEFSFKNL